MWHVSDMSSKLSTFHCDNTNLVYAIGKTFAYLGSTSFATQLIIHIIQQWMFYSLLSGTSDVGNVGCQKKPVLVMVSC